VHSSIPCHILLPYSSQARTLSFEEGIVASPHTFEDAENITVLLVCIFSIRHTDVELSERVGKSFEDLDD
jgi:hypothetical protein